MMAVVAACGTTDCPLNNTVRQVSKFYTTDGTPLTIEDTLIVTSRDSIILNRATKSNIVMLPMSYNGDIDTIVMRYKPQGEIPAAVDTIFIHKTNVPHYISLDCGTGVFHTITDVKWTRRTPTAHNRYAIDSIAIKNNTVTYDEKENLQIYFAVYQ